MGFAYIIAGCIFFFLPNFNIMDILPDFIGCILIVKGLTKVSDLVPSLSDAKKSFKTLILIYLAKFILMFSVPFLGNNDDTTILVYTFVFAILDMIYTIPAFKKMLDGIVYLGNRTESSSVFKNQSEVQTITSLYFIVRAGLALLCDLTYISRPEASEFIQPDGFYLSNYRTLLVALNVLITTFIGVIWLVYIIKYFSGIKKDKSFVEYLKERYSKEVLANENLITRRNINFAIVVLMFAIVFMIDFQIDLVNVIPDFLGAFAFLWFAFLILKYTDSKKLFITSSIFALTSSVAWAIHTYYAVKFPYVNVWSNAKANSLFIKVNIFIVIKYISLILVLLVLKKVLKNIIYKHTGSTINELQSVILQRSSEQARFERENNRCCVFGIIACVVSIVRFILLYELPVFFIFDILINGLWAVSFINLLSKINSAIEYKYM